MRHTVLHRVLVRVNDGLRGGLWRLLRGKLPEYEEDERRGHDLDGAIERYVKQRVVENIEVVLRLVHDR